jgi:hypothetical protein
VIKPLCLGVADGKKGMRDACIEAIDKACHVEGVTRTPCCAVVIGGMAGKDSGLVKPVRKKGHSLMDELCWCSITIWVEHFFGAINDCLSLPFLACALSFDKIYLFNERYLPFPIYCRCLGWSCWSGAPSVSVTLTLAPASRTSCRNS